MLILVQYLTRLLSNRRRKRSSTTSIQSTNTVKRNGRPEWQFVTSVEFLMRYRNIITVIIVIYYLYQGSFNPNPKPNLTWSSPPPKSDQFLLIIYRTAPKHFTEVVSKIRQGFPQWGPLNLGGINSYLQKSIVIFLTAITQNLIIYTMDYVQPFHKIS